MKQQHELPELETMTSSWFGGVTKQTVGWQIDDALYKVILRIFLMLFSQGFCWAFVSLGQ